MRGGVWIGSAFAIVLAAAIPAGATQRYTVAVHDTLYSIARHFGISVTRLAELNDLRNPNRIRPGEALRIPQPGPIVRPAAPASSSQYTVRRGDTLYSLARSHGLTVQALADANALSAPDVLRVGQTVRIPAAPRPAVTKPAVAAPEIAQTPGSGAAQRTIQHPAASSFPVSSSRALLGRRITDSAMRYLGTRYIWAGTGLGGVDCSGLVYAVYAPYVPRIPRMSYDQWFFGTPVARDTLEPGDLVFFNINGSGPSHVGIYIGGGRLVHAAASAGRVVIDLLGAPYYASHYLGARRVL